MQVRQQVKGRGKGKRPREEVRTVEYWGVAIGYKNGLERHRSYVRPISGNLIEMAFKMRGPPLVIIGAYAPHSKRPIEEREGFYTALTETVDRIPLKHEVIIAGDLNVRFHARRKEETDVLGPHVYGRGAEFMEKCEAKVKAASIVNCL